MLEDSSTDAVDADDSQVDRSSRPLGLSQFKFHALSTELWSQRGLRNDMLDYYGETDVRKILPSNDGTIGLEDFDRLLGAGMRSLHGEQKRAKAVHIENLVTV